ncbi:hypothetical protein sos41_16750 [Alphaproteobacteria bacterium SO-S41]|nr:hypothetical protein sos41_16750 [Alphaproteobacteria bacterium SO-S41]
MTEWRLIDAWADAARSLDVTLCGPGPFTLKDGTPIAPDLRVPDFGNLRGAIVFTDPAAAEPHRAAILAAAHSLHIFPPPEPGHMITAPALAKLLADWGWNGSEKGRPEWA